MITDIIQKLMLLIVGVLFLASVAAILLRFKNVNRTERTQIFKTAEYLNAWMILICFVTTMLYGIVNHFELKKSVHAIISLNYSEASQALNSNGTRYNMAEIISDEVVERAIRKGALKNVTTKQLKNCLYVYPCVQGGVGDETQYHISTEFAVGYHASKDTAHLDSENVIKLITSAYKEYYIEKYTDNFSLDSEKPDFSKMEYMDIVLYFDKEAQSILNYLYGMAGKNPSFVTENGSTFNSIAGKVFDFKETQINQNLRSLILQNGIVRDRDGYVGRLSYQNTNVDFDRQKNHISYLLCNQAVAMYSEEMTRIVLVPTWDKSGKYYMGRTKVGIDELSVMATNFSNYMASNEKEIMDNNLIINKILSNHQGAQLSASADALIDSIYEDIKGFEKEAITAGREYFRHKMNQCIAVSIYGISLMSELKPLVMFAALLYLALVLFRISKKFPKKA
ncbi:MAG: hypothetical protein E7397_00965 [Ruminococcaceae bacterium]|nr:hypothetical protein [Oscillospiraceae bacterium]